MASLPEEVWLLIFKFVQAGVPNPGKGREFRYDLARTASVRPLTETCRTFHRICQPLLFETLVIKYSSEPSRRVVDVLQSKPHLRSMVTNVRISWTHGGDRTHDLWDRLEKALVELHSVRDLWIRGADISRTPWDHFQQCPRLERLVLINVSIIGATEPTSVSFHSLKHLRYEPHRNLQVTNFHTVLILPQLETLHIGSMFLSGAADLCSHRVFQFKSSVLKGLFIESIFWSWGMEAGLLELLRRANRIESLGLSGLAQFSSGSNLSNDIIPDLETFRGPAHSVLTYCKGRRVRDLFTWFPFGTTWDMTDDIPNLIQPGSAPLEHLHIGWASWKDDTMGYIARHCPQLVSLKIQARRIDGTLSARCHMPKLRKATFLSSEGSWFSGGSDSNLKAESEIKVVEECREFWSQLEYLRLDPGYFWSYRGAEVKRVLGEEE